MLTENLAKWQMLLSEFDIVYVTLKEIKAQALADHLVENTVDKEYEPLKTYLHDKVLAFMGEDISEIYLAGDYSLMEHQITKGKISERS